MIKVHKSWLKIFAKCPLWYKRVVIDGYVDESGYEAELGSAFHEYAEKFFEIAWMHRDEMPDVILRIRPDTRNLELKRMTLWFRKIEYERWKQLEFLGMTQYWWPKYREMHFEVEDVLDGEKILLEGTIDRVDPYGGKNTVRIIEYKTMRSRNYTDVRMELMFYAYAYEKLTNEQVAGLRIINPMLEEIVDVRFHAATAKKLQRLLREFVRAHRFEYWPAKPGWHCAYCPLREECMARYLDGTLSKKREEKPEWLRDYV